MEIGRWYTERLLPRCLDLAMRGAKFRELRPTCVGEARGRVLELGFGSGLNLPFYSDGVDEVVAVDPAVLGRRLARERIATAPFPVRFAGLDGDRLELEDSSFDSVVSTWTLCTVPSPSRTLAEIGRVLRAGGRFHFLEHGRAPDGAVARWQDRLNPIQARLFGGCRLDRRIDELVRTAPIGEVRCETFYSGRPRALSHLFRGTAVKVS
ncbi:MAG: class I SAM-dependent methyltransferase [Planctomycetota bacterium]|jgi:ubiquinone/menaquinone biosynthesis C-methylase UbiE|nr:class I SAM-dependent methyltransferase [Planctomycetota bacterium]MDP6762796.1 class I SAM-dependent methyltransferase [Planctomycetota bacterium]MDP6988333.1 class I SAM-dependent methyltransferase [Planctomycetota bacterium]